ncbi:MAG TPA: plastocyanin/azurin family copper-binding protein [Prolixibacteraceae bacterium]|jgi:plastocyanin
MTFVIAISTLNLVGQTKHSVSVTNYQFTPKELTITAGDTVVWTNATTTGHNVDGLQSVFPTNPESFGNTVGPNWVYEFVFKTPGTYNYHCDPHALSGMTGSVIVNPPLKLTVNFTAMTPHVGETFWLAVIDTTSKMEIGRKKLIGSVAFSVEVPGIVAGKAYNVDFWADHNKNGVYDAPGADHAWRLKLNNVKRDTILNFVHNTNFTDIKWKTKLTLHFTAMNPHVGQMLTLYVRDKAMGMGLDTVVVKSVAGPEFDVSSWAIEPAKSYNLDIWADLNKNGIYNAPPADHAWRIVLDNVKSDTIINFVHNTVFTDISIPTANEELVGTGSIRLYPNPANQYIELLVPDNHQKVSSLKVYSVTGTLVDQKILSGNVGTFRYNLGGFKNGVYFMEITAGTQKEILKFLKQ